ncbi:neuropeptides capa receptor-like [Gigantopelta aegis]|uniref:neuropeptides capa receptor-like n=1 Tax=Gigantopelta aegis TaxID=1735272 RepID=UPI001B88853F|nr:neuropeptides capa receptor-like [Gigantopelta aegis]
MTEVYSCEDCQPVIVTPTGLPSLNGTGNGSTYMFSIQDHMTYRVAHILHTYVLPSDIFIGLMANLISILVFTGKDLRNLSSSVYVLAVLIADSGSLITMVAVWLEVLKYPINHMQGMCQFFVYLTYICSFLSVWYMVCITVENYITFCHPTRIKIMCTQSRARMVTIALAVGALCLYSVSPFIVDVTSDPNYPNYSPTCRPKPSYIVFNDILTYIDSVLTLLVPSVAILLMLTAIVVSIVSSLRKKKRRMVKDQPRAKNKADCPQVRVAKMLFALSSTYLILNLPSHVIRLFFLLRPNDVTQPNITMEEGLMMLIFLYLSYLNSCVKFFLLFAFSANFRKRILGTCVFKRCQVYIPVSTGATKV